MDRRGAGADEVNAAAARARAEARAEAKKAKDQWRIENPLEAIAAIIWYINKIISIEEETPRIQSLTFFGFVVIFIIYCFIISLF